MSQHSVNQAAFEAQANRLAGSLSGGRSVACGFFVTDRERLNLLQDLSEDESRPTVFLGGSRIVESVAAANDATSGQFTVASKLHCHALPDELGDDPERWSHWLSALSAVIPDAPNRLAVIEPTVLAPAVLDVLLTAFARPEWSASSICVIFDLRRADPWLLDASLNVFPAIVGGGRVLANPFRQQPATDRNTVRGRFTSRMQIVKKLASIGNVNASLSYPGLLQHALEAASEAILIADSDGLVRYVNPAFVTLTGYQRSAMRGRSSPFLDWHADAGTTLAGYPDAGEAFGVARQHSATRADGSRYYASTTVTPLLDETGGLDGFVAVHRDITREVERTAKLHRCVKDAALSALGQQEGNADDQAPETSADSGATEPIANEIRLDQNSIGKSVALLSHELRAPLTSILGFAEQLRSGELTPKEQAQALETIHEGGRYLLQLVNNVLDLSKLQAGELRAEKTQAHPLDCVRGVWALVQQTAAANATKVIAEPEGLLPETILTDPLRLQQILLNLVGNAIKFTPGGDVRIEVRLLAETEQIEYAVRDTGEGIAPDALQKLFQPFQQSDANTERRARGTGLGLTISARLAELLGARLSVESSLGAGSVFRLRVPTGSLTEVSLRQMTDADTGAAMSDSGDDSGRLSETVLIVDDAAENLRLVTHWASRAGLAVHSAESGAAAIDWIAEAATPPHLILLDLHMPGMDGATACQRLRAAGFAGPIVAMSAEPAHSAKPRAMEAGCDGFLEKPFTRQQLMAAIRDQVAPAHQGDIGTPVAR